MHTNSQPEIRINWNSQKSKELQVKRNICFEDVVWKLIKGEVIADLLNPNQDKYPNQRLFVIEFKSYVYVIPYTQEDDIFLKTIYPSRKLTERFIKGGN
jgi:uncharacterized DUF497 family protein